MSSDRPFKVGDRVRAVDPDYAPPHDDCTGTVVGVNYYTTTPVVEVRPDVEGDTPLVYFPEELTLLSDDAFKLTDEEEDPTLLTAFTADDTAAATAWFHKLDEMGSTQFDTLLDENAVWRRAGRCYIAGPMSGIPDFNFPAFDDARNLLTDHGWDVVSPADLDRADGFNEVGCTGHEPLTDADKQGFARNDIGALLTVSTIALLPGWENSTGARNEMSIAGWLGLDVIDATTGEPLVCGVGTGDWSGKPERSDGHPPPAPTTERNPRAEVLLTAEELVNGDRNMQYGDPTADFQRTATFWTTYLDGKTTIEAHDVAVMMALLKCSRIRWSPEKLDSWVDGAGYMACGWDTVKRLILDAAEDAS